MRYRFKFGLFFNIDPLASREIERNFKDDEEARGNVDAIRDEIAIEINAGKEAFYRYDIVFQSLTRIEQPVMPEKSIEIMRGR